MNRKIILLPLTIAASFAMVACGGSNEGASSSSSAEQAATTSSVQEEVISIVADKTSVTLKVGETALVTATVSGTTNTSKTWTSQNEAVATVKAGLITAVGVGSTKIVVTSSADASVKAEIAVTVEDVEKTTIGSITAAKNGLTLNGIIVAKDSSNGFIIDDGTGAMYVYSSKDILGSKYTVGSYVSVTGDVFAYYKQCFQMGSYDAGTKTQHADLKVGDGIGAKPTLKAPVALTSEITKNWKQETSPILPKDVGPYTFTAKATVNGSNVSFNIEGETVAIGAYHYSSEFKFVNDVTYEITGYSAGYTTHGGTSLLMLISGVEGQYDPIASVTVSAASNSTFVGGKLQLRSSVAPAAANPKVVWSTNDETIATIDENGLLTGVKAGTVTVTATSAANSVIKATKEITVKESAELPLETIFHGAFDNGWTLAKGTSTANWYGNGGLKLSQVNKDYSKLISPKFAVSNSVTVSLSFASFNENQKTDDKRDETKVFTVVGLNEAGTAVDTKYIANSDITEPNKYVDCALDGEGITKVTIAYTNWYKMSSGKFANLSLNKIKLAA